MKNPELVEKIKQLAQEHGYNCIGYTEAANLSVTEDVRAMCASNTCHSYDKNWSCPPACGSIDEWGQRIKKYSDCVVFETVAELEDEFDIDTMMDTNDEHKERMLPFADDVREVVSDCLFLAAGPCTICDECSYPDDPCRFPDKQFVAMEAAGMVVSKVCVAADIPYNHGSDHVAYVSCVLF